MALAACVAGSPAAAQELPGTAWYVGAGAGVSRLTPDTEASAFDLEEEGGAAFGAWLGRDLGRRFAVEGAIASLGEAGLSGGESIAYRAVSGGVVVHVLGDRARMDAPSLYLRAGLSRIDNESDVQLERADSTSVWAGVGAEYPFARRWLLRGELATYDGDAQAGFVTVFRRFGGLRSGGPVVAREPAPAADERAVARASAAPEEAVPAAEPPPPPTAPARDPRPASRSAPSASSEPPAGAPTAACGTPSANEPVDARGCALYSGPLDGAAFVAGTATPTAAASAALAEAARRLNEAPGLVVEIRAHVGASRGEAAAQALSRERAVAVARAFASAGVDLSRLRARAFGASVPGVSEGLPDERIVLRVLP